jgi:hypothetical protein
MTEDDCDALSQKHLASIKRDMRVSLEDATVRATHKVMVELEIEQDCVGWFGYDTGLRLWFEANKGDDGAIPLYKDPKPCPTCEALARTVMLDQTSHDTTPPQRTWVGLTDEEIDKAWRSVDYTVPWEQHRIDIAQAIEAKLKEKNT